MFVRQPQKRSLRRGSKRRAAAAVEFAMAAPVFFAIFFGAIEITRANLIGNSAEVAATEGARRGVIPGATVADCIAAATAELEAVGVDRFEIAVVPNQITAATRTVRVDVQIPLEPQNGFFLSGLFAGKNLTRTIELIREQ